MSEMPSRRSASREGGVSRNLSSTGVFRLNGIPLIVSHGMAIAQRGAARMRPSDKAPHALVACNGVSRLIFHGLYFEKLRNCARIDGLETCLSGRKGYLPMALSSNPLRILALPKKDILQKDLIGKKFNIRGK